MMLKLFTWLVRLVSLALVALVALTLGAYYFAARSLPDYDADFALEGVSAPLEIVRSTENVPHIFGASDADVFFGLGFAHAQDRLWQMNLARRTAQGRMSEVFGAATLASDELMRRLDLYGQAQASVAAQDAQTQEALAAYARGVNAWIGEVNRDALGRGAPEFFWFKNELAYWTPADSLAILKLMGLKLSGNAADEVLRAKLAILDPTYAADLLPDAGAGAKLADYAALMGLSADHAAILPAPAGPLPDRARLPASNAFASAPNRSAAGGALMANDPHMALEAPAAWYLARLELASGGVIGATLPGVPVVLSGRSARLGWGITAAAADDMDVVMERLDPAQPDHYLAPEGPRPFETRRAIVEVLDAAPVTLTLRWSANGPVLPSAQFDLGAVTPAGHVPALAWAGRSMQDRSLTALMGVMRAGSLAEAEAAGADLVTPVLTMTLADRATVGVVTMGALPLRDAGHETQGRMPARGDKAQNLWRGMRDYAAAPREIAPAGGIVGNTNTRVGPARPFPDHLAFRFGDSQRIQRLALLMGEREVHTRESFIAAQLDIVSPAARGILPLIGADLWFTGEAAPEGSAERLRQRALEVIARWDGAMNEHLPEPLIYAAWVRALQQRLIRDELGAFAEVFSAPEPEFLTRVYTNKDGAARWCDVVQSAPKESCTEMAREALDDALLELSQRYGPNVESWRWGDAHEARHMHSVFGRVPALDALVNIRQSTSGGDFTLAMGRMESKGEAPYANVFGAVYRGVYDFADPDSSVFILSTGQSGHPLSRHYDDMADLWRRGEYVPMSLDPALARAAAAGVTKILPAEVKAD